VTTPAEFQTYLDASEGAHFEFKQAKSSFEFEDLVEYCVAIANEGGGKIILGVTDKKPRRVVGTAAFLEPQRTEKGLFDRLHHRIEVEEFPHPDGRVVIVHVPSRLPGTVWQYKGCRWMRSGDALVPMSDDVLKAIYAETGPDYSAEICPSAIIADLDPVAIADFRQRWSKKANSPRVAARSDEETLTDAELLVEGRLTYAALILFGTHVALGRHLAQAEVIFEYRSVEAAGPAQDRLEYREGFFKFHDQLWQKINLRNDRQSYQDNFFRFEIPTFDESIVRESILNAVCHRDYRHGGSVFVRQFARRLEVVSPGGFPPGITPENVLDQQNPRNRRLAEAFGRCGMVERSGQGMNLMFERSILQSKPLPDFTGSAAHEVRLTLQGTVTNPQFIRFLEKVGEETTSGFSTQDLLILDCLQRGEKVPESLTSRLPHLVGLKVIEPVSRGRGARYILSRELYEHLGQKGTYTRKRGLDRETNKQLLVKHLENYHQAGCRLQELNQVLPDLTRRQVQGLLRELRTEGRAHSVGQTNAGRWYPGATSKAIAPEQGTVQ
jgi:ATP-dependent DNA helicase RecG